MADKPPYIYTIGYQQRPPDDIKKAVEELGALLVDIRLNAASRYAPYRKESWKALVGEANYLYLPAYGNANYKQPELGVRLADPEEAATVLAPILATRPVILMCGCVDVEHCHRKDAAAHLSAATQRFIVHLRPGDGGGGAAKPARPKPAPMPQGSLFAALPEPE